MKKCIATILLCMFIRTLAAETADSLAYRVENLAEVEIVANRAQTRKLLAPQQYFSYSNELINFANRQNMSDLLMETGNVAVQKSQQGGGSPMLRGFEASRILLVVDGIRMNNLIYRSGHLQNSITVDQFMLENVEVLNGPSSLNFGSDALGGTILFNTRNPKLSDGGKLLFKGNAAFRYGSVNNEGTSHVDFNFGTERFASLTSVTYSHFGDLKAGRNRNPFLPDDDAYIVCDGYVQTDRHGNDTYIPNTDTYRQVGSGYDQYDLMQKFLFRTESNDTHLFNFQLSNTRNINRYDRLTETTEKNGTVLPKYASWYYGPQFRLLSAYHYQTHSLWGADKAGLTIAYQKVKESRHNRKFGDPVLNNRWEAVDMLTVNTDWEKSTDRHRIQTGVDGMVSFLRSTANLENIQTGELSENSTRYPDGKNLMATAEAFLMHKWDISSKLRMTDGLRIGYAHTRSTVKDVEAFPFFDGEELIRRNFTYSIAWGLNYLPAKTWKLALSAATAYRVPNIDNTSKIFDSKTGTVTIPNAALKPEKTVSADINITKHIDGVFSWENVIFGTLYFDAITTGAGTFQGNETMWYDGTECLVYTSLNNKRALLWGYSSVLTAKPTRSVELRASFNYTYGRIVGDEDKPLDHIPPIFGRIGVAYLTSNDKGRLECYVLYNGAKHVSDYNLEGEDNLNYATVNGTDGAGTPAWYTLNLKGSYQCTPTLLIQAGIENILDTQYRLFASGINAPGRNIYAALRMNF